MAIKLHRGDLPADVTFGQTVAIDTETMGLNPHRDRLCVVQMSNGDGTADVVQVPKGHRDAPNLKFGCRNAGESEDGHLATSTLA